MAGGWEPEILQDLRGDSHGLGGEFFVGNRQRRDVL